jgi:hypothetical protein
MFSPRFSVFSCVKCAQVYQVIFSSIKFAISCTNMSGTLDAHLNRLVNNHQIRSICKGMPIVLTAS